MVGERPNKGTEGCGAERMDQPNGAGDRARTPRGGDGGEFAQWGKPWRRKVGGGKEDLGLERFDRGKEMGGG